MNEVSTYRFHVAFGDADPAGRLFFARLFDHAHRAYERFMESRGWPLHRVMEEQSLLIPLVHAEADYLHPCLTGDELTVEVEILRTGGSSMSVGYRFIGDDGGLRARATTVHVFIDRDTGVTRPVPAGLRC
jgi:YbgC/YbaW family acyl-CoA thioester hydrolase